MKEVKFPPDKEGTNYCRHCETWTYHSWSQYMRRVLTCHKCYNLWSVDAHCMVDRQMNPVPGTGLSSKEKKAIKKGSGGRVIR